MKLEQIKNNLKICATVGIKLPHMAGFVTLTKYGSNEDCVKSYVYNDSGLITKLDFNEIKNVMKEKDYNSDHWKLVANDECPVLSGYYNMNYDKAKELCLAGLTLSRNSWVTPFNDVKIKLNETNSIIRVESFDDHNEVNVYVPTEDDLNANDWYIVSEENAEHLFKLYYNPDNKEFSKNNIIYKHDYISESFLSYHEIIAKMYGLRYVNGARKILTNDNNYGRDYRATRLAWIGQDKNIALSEKNLLVYEKDIISEGVPDLKSGIYYPTEEDVRACDWLIYQ